MSDFIPKPGSIKIGGLGPKAARLQALREKAARRAAGKSDAHPGAHPGSPASPARSNAAAPARKTAFNRKAV